MPNKLISSIMLACSFAVMPLSGSHPDNLLFIFISPSRWAGVIRLLLALTMFFISFASLKGFNDLISRHSKGRPLTLGLGMGLIAFGLFGALESSLGTVFFDYLKPLDIMIILETGIIISSAALSAAALPPVSRRKLPAARKPRKVAPKLHETPA